MGLLKRAVEIRCRDIRDPNLSIERVDAELVLVTMLQLAVSRFQSCRYGDEIWSSDVAETPFIGAFRSVPMKFYSDDRFSEVLDLYYPDLKQQRWSAEVAEGMLTFVNGFAHDNSDRGEALSIVERLFLRQYVWPDPKVRHAIYRDRTRAIEHRPLIRSVTRMFARAETVTWSEMQGSFSVAKPDGIAVDQNLKDLIELIVEHDGWAAT